MFHEWEVHLYAIISKKSLQGVVPFKVLYYTQGVHCSSTVNIHVLAQKGYYFEQAYTKCTYKRHSAIK